VIGAIQLEPERAERARQEREISRPRLELDLALAVDREEGLVGRRTAVVLKEVVVVVFGQETQLGLPFRIAGAGIGGRVAL